MGCLKARQESGYPWLLDIVHKVSAGDDGYPHGCKVRRTTENRVAEESGQIVGGTAFFFSRTENIHQIDWLFVDEAGQVSLANMTAMGRAARNIVLVGDPRQLPQVIQEAHPEPANWSCLEWMLAGHATVPPDRGIFLATTRRMHPDVGHFISEQVYEGRLVSHPDTARQRVFETDFPEAGAFWVPVPHDGNAQVSLEEVEAISKAAKALLGGRMTDKDGAFADRYMEVLSVIATNDEGYDPEATLTGFDVPEYGASVLMLSAAEHQRFFPISMCGALCSAEEKPQSAFFSELVTSSPVLKSDGGYNGPAI
jgi:hypothetical protein